jgi:hypothetical protein
MTDLGGGKRKEVDRLTVAQAAAQANCQLGEERNVSLVAVQRHQLGHPWPGVEERQEDCLFAQRDLVAAVLEADQLLGRRLPAA